MDKIHQVDGDLQTRGDLFSFQAFQVKEPENILGSLRQALNLPFDGRQQLALEFLFLQVLFVFRKDLQVFHLQALGSLPPAVIVGTTRHGDTEQKGSQVAAIFHTIPVVPQFKYAIDGDILRIGLIRDDALDISIQVVEIQVIDML